MPVQNGFDNERYLEQQSAAILDRVKESNGKLYLEFGGKLIFDYHAAGLRKLGVNMTSEPEFATKYLFVS